MRTDTTYTRYKENPFIAPKEARSALIYSPDAYTLSVIMGLSAGALRVLLVMGAYVSAETGKVHVTALELRERLGGLACNISRAKTELVRANLLAYAKGKDSYYLTERLFKSFRITA